MHNFLHIPSNLCAILINNSFITSFTYQIHTQNQHVDNDFSSHGVCVTDLTEKAKKSFILISKSASRSIYIKTKYRDLNFMFCSLTLACMCDTIFRLSPMYVAYSFIVSMHSAAACLLALLP